MGCKVTQLGDLYLFPQVFFYKAKYRPTAESWRRTYTQETKRTIILGYNPKEFGLPYRAPQLPIPSNSHSTPKRIVAELQLDTGASNELKTSSKNVLSSLNIANPINNNAFSFNQTLPNFRETKEKKKGYIPVYSTSLIPLLLCLYLAPYASLATYIPRYLLSTTTTTNSGLDDSWREWSDRGNW